MIRSLDLPLAIDVANDPFFGRAGRMLANNQRQQNLKFELNVPVNSVEKPTACLSFNYHQDHFGTTWDLRQATAASPTPPASASAWSGSPWRSCATTAWTSRPGRIPCAPRLWG